MTSPRNLVKFFVLCLVWGLTWIAMKIGVGAVPPMLFAATRFTAAGVVLIGIAVLQNVFIIPRRQDVARLLVTSLLMITLCYGPLFWGMKYIPSGSAAVLEMSLTPLALLAFGIALGEERWSTARVCAMALGVFGLSVLFAPQITAPNLSWPVLFGLASVAWAAISSAWGSVLARPLVSRYGSRFLSGSTTLMGGFALLIGSLLIEQSAGHLMPATWPLNALAGWLFLVIFGSLVGYSIYMQLLRDIGPAKAGSFAFVSPAIAVAVGAAAAGEAVTIQDLTGMALMLLAAAGCLFADQLTNLIVRRRKWKVSQAAHIAKKC